MIKKFVAKLMGWKEQRMNLGQRRFNEAEALERDLAKEREEMQHERIKEEKESQWEEVKIPEDLESEDSK